VLTLVDADTAPALLKLKGVRKSYGTNEVVCGVDLELAAGECFGLLGPNGAGKTTTLRLALGLTDPDAGEITLLGEPIPRRAREARVRLGVVPQVDNLDPDFTVVENLLVYGRYFGLREQDVRARIPRLLEFAGLESRAGSRIQALSGGMKRRLALARALVNDPDLLFLDEPTTGLDPQARRSLWEIVRRMKAEGRTVILTTHYMEEAEALCDRLAIMDHGRVLTVGTPLRLIQELEIPSVVELAFDGDAPPAASFARRLGQPVEVRGGMWEIPSPDPKTLLPELLDAAEAEGVPFAQIHMRRATLEDVFLHRTGRSLRE
jgi:ABC-2 type transport system ATP-binding protein